MECHRPRPQPYLRLAVSRRNGQNGQNFGPWSATWTLTTPDIPEGYIAGGEVYDPLWTGKTVGQPIGAVEFLPNTGAKMVGFTSYIEYVLGQTVADGEFSMLVTNVPTNTEGGKTKIMSMREGRCCITTNDRRFTIEKRGNPAGAIAWRVITSRDQIDTVGNAERVKQALRSRQVVSLDGAMGRRPVQSDDS